MRAQDRRTGGRSRACCPSRRSAAGCRGRGTTARPSPRILAPTSRLNATITGDSRCGRTWRPRMTGSVGAERPRRLDELALAQREHDAPHQPRVDRKADDGDGDHRVAQPGAEPAPRCAMASRMYGKRHQDVGQPHDHGSRPSPCRSRRGSRASRRSASRPPPWPRRPAATRGRPTPAAPAGRARTRRCRARWPGVRGGRRRFGVSTASGSSSGSQGASDGEADRGTSERAATASRLRRAVRASAARAWRAAARAMRAPTSAMRTLTPLTRSGCADRATRRADRPPG